MDKNKISNFLGILDSIQQNSEQKAYLENCKNLNELSEFIISKYPKSELSKDEVKKCLTAFDIILRDNKAQNIRHLNDNQLDISGGLMSYETRESVDRWKERSQTLRKGAVMADIMAQVMDTIDEGGAPDMLGMSDKMVAALSGQTLTGNYKADGMAKTSGRVRREINKHVDDISRTKIHRPDKLSQIKRHDTTGRTSQHRFTEFTNID